MLIEEANIIILRFLLSACLSGVHRKLLDPEPRAAASLGHWWLHLEATERMPLCTLAKALATGWTRTRYKWTLTSHSERPDDEAA